MSAQPLVTASTTTAQPGAVAAGVTALHKAGKGPLAGFEALFASLFAQTDIAGVQLGLGKGAAAPADAGQLAKAAESAAAGAISTAAQAAGLKSADAPTSDPATGTAQTAQPSAALQEQAKLATGQAAPQLALATPVAALSAPRVAAPT